MGLVRGVVILNRFRSIAVVVGCNVGGCGCDALVVERRLVGKALS